MKPLNFISNFFWEYSNSLFFWERCLKNTIPFLNCFCDGFTIYVAIFKSSHQFTMVCHYIVTDGCFICCSAIFVRGNLIRTQAFYSFSEVKVALLISLLSLSIVVFWLINISLAVYPKLGLFIDYFFRQLRLRRDLLSVLRKVFSVGCFDFINRLAK